MPSNEDIRRVAQLETEVSHLKQDIGDLKSKLAYYDKMALKWGGVAIVILTLGAASTMGFDKIKEKIATWLLP